MKIQDLMVGDWVKNDLGETQQVVELREEMVMLSYNDIYPYDYIDPIPITPEILEKNGFVKQGFPGWGIFAENYHILWRCDYNPGILDIRSFNTQFGNYTRFYTKYIHELQHALHLCGIDNEIQL